jgi:hypothetical protein
LWGVGFNTTSDISVYQHISTSANKHISTSSHKYKHKQHASSTAAHTSLFLVCPCLCSQFLHCDATGGAFTLSLGGGVTTAIFATDTPAQLQAKLLNMSAPTPITNATVRTAVAAAVTAVTAVVATTHAHAHAAAAAAAVAAAVAACAVPLLLLLLLLLVLCRCLCCAAACAVPLLVLCCCLCCAAACAVLLFAVWRAAR